MGRWGNPLPGFSLVLTDDPMSFAGMGEGITGIPFGRHPGSFGFVRRNHVHEGVDLYVPDGTPVAAVEDGIVVAIQDFTGVAAGMPWWEDTKAILVEGGSGVVCYGEVDTVEGVEVGAAVSRGEVLGRVRRVLRKDKGRPMSMLHVELHVHGTRFCPEWAIGGGKPETSLDPTPFLASCDGVAGK